MQTCWLFGALALIASLPLLGQTSTQTLLEGYPSWAFDPQTYGGSTPLVEFGLFQRPYDLFQFNQSVVGAVQTSSSGSGWTTSPTTAYQGVLAGRTDQLWAMAHPYVRMTFQIPTQNNGTSNNGGQLIIGQEPYNGNLASYTVQCYSSPDNTTWTLRGQAAITTAWGQLSVPFASTDSYLRVLIAQSTSVINISAIKFLVFSPSVNTNNNQPFYNDFFGNMQIGAATAAPIAALSPTRLQVQGATADSSSNAFWVTNVNGTSTGNSLFYVRDDGAVAIDSGSPAQCGSAVCALTVNGTVATKEVIVTSGITADYVFRPDYRLASLRDVDSYIKDHHHLPDIPSEAEVRENGVNLGEMQAKLLAKIEELTLHLIQEEESNRNVQERITKLESSTAGAAR